MTNKEELLRKIKALADKGTGGEKSSANAILTKLMDKYGITEESIDEEHVETRWFKYSDEIDKRLLCQVMYMVTGDAENCWVNKGKRKQRGCKCTILQGLEIEALFAFYRRQLKKDLKIFYSAFLFKNEIFPAVTINEAPNGPSDDDFEKIANMAEGMEKHDFRRQLQYTGGSR